MRSLRTPPRRLAAAGLALLLLLPAASAAAADEVFEQAEPRPPWIFFPEPDEQTAPLIDELLANSFADLNKVIDARALMVHRFGLWSVPTLVVELRDAHNEPRTHNAALTVHALRDALGPARQLWPALEPLVVLAETSPEPYRRAFALLALGSFHGPASIPPPPRHRDPLQVRDDHGEAERLLVRARHVMGRQQDHGHAHVQVAASLALAKTGGPEAREALASAEGLDGAIVEPRQALLLAMGLLPRDDDMTVLIEALGDEQGQIRRAAALAASLQALVESPPEWTRFPDPLLRALTSEPIRQHLDDGAEATFTRGVYALRGQLTETWRALFELATTASTDSSTAIAAAQALLFCAEPWFAEFALDRMSAGTALHEEVFAAFLVTLASRGEPGAVEIAREYLRNPARAPRGDAAWDVRHHAAVGLLRALARGRIQEPEVRATALRALRGGVGRGLADGPFRDALAAVLEAEGERLEADGEARLSPEGLARVTSAWRDPHGLLLEDIHAMAILRLNDMMPVVFNINALRPAGPDGANRREIPRRFLKACLDEFPYFSVLDLQADRGLRPAPQLDGGDDPDLVVNR